MILEDDILAYLDGSLDDEASAELLHKLSQSPKHRAMLDEHLRMRELFALGQKPLAVPERTERMLAARIPVLAQSAQPIASSIRRTGILATLYQSAQTFIAGHRLATGLSLAGLLAATGLLWNTASNTVPVIVKQSQLKIAVAVAEQRDVAVAENGSSSLDRANRSYGSYRSNASNQSNASNFVQSQRSVVAAGSVKANGSLTEALPYQTNSQKHVATTPAETPSLRVAAEAQLPMANEEQLPISEAAPRFADAASAPAYALIRQPLLSEEELPEHTHPFTVGLSYGTYQYFLAHSASQASGPKEILGTPEASVMYEANEHSAFGIEGGYSYFSGVQFRAESNTPNSFASANSYSRIAYSPEVTAQQMGWVRGAYRYTFNPMSDLIYSASIAGGASFSDKVLPNTALSFGVSRMLPYDLMLDANAIFVGNWGLKNASATSVNADGTYGVVYSSSANQVTFTPTLGARIGLRYRL